MKKQKELVLIKSEGEIAQAEAQIVELSKRIEFYLTEYSVELLANKMSKGEFVVPVNHTGFRGGSTPERIES
ncbi:TPA: hypothetical protein MAZ16_000635 [Klebsiella pneumoniae]